MCWCGRALRGRGAAEDGDLARPDSPSRCTLPITALRVMPPSSAAIWLADSPSVHSFFSSLDPFVGPSHGLNPSPVGAEKSGQNPPMAGAPTLAARRLPPPRCTLVTCPPHDMSYLTIERLQYGESQAQEFGRTGVHMFIHCRALHPHLSAWMPGRAAPARRRPGAPDHVDSRRRRNKIPARAARRGGTFHLQTDRLGVAEQRSRIASVAGLRARRSRLRARRGRVADRHQRRALSRFHLGRRGQCARPRASASGRGDHRAGQEGLARLQSLPHPRGRAAGRAAVRGELRRRGVLRQFRRRGDGMRDQDGAQIPIGERPAGALPHHHLRGRLPRPHAGDARRRRPEEISRRLRPGGRRLRPGAVRRSRSDQARHRAGDRRAS